MQWLRQASIQEYAIWYLTREANKSKRALAPLDPRVAVATMNQEHRGKMRPWFQQVAKWSIVLLDPSEFERLIFLESDWTKTEGLVEVTARPNYRTLSRVAENAKRVEYLARPSAQRHRSYHEAFQSGALALAGDSRIAICTAGDHERHHNPSGSFYLLDGVGRCLPYMMLIQSDHLNYRAVEALLAEKLE